MKLLSARDPPREARRHNITSEVRALMAEPQDRWMNQLFVFARDLLEKLFEPRTLKLFLLAAGALALAMLEPGRAVGSDIDLGAVSLSKIITWTFISLGVTLTLGAISSGLLELRLQTGDYQSAARRASDQTRVLGADVVISLDVARYHISYGALRFEAPPGGKEVNFLRDVRFKEEVPTRTRTLRSGESRRQLYDQMLLAVIDVLNALEQQSDQVKVSGITVSTPSWIDIKAKALASPIGPFPVNEGIAENLARYLWDRHPERIRRAFALPGVAVDSRQDLMARIFLDTDSRSVARYDLHERLRSGTTWENYACVIILEGIGAGLILNREIYYGSHASEGEIGHTTVHLESEYRLDSTPGSGITIDRCSCQLPGIHWESVGGTTGLLLLAAAINNEKFLRLQTAYGRLVSGRDLLNAACLVKVADSPAEIPAEVWRLVTEERRNYEEYFDAIFKEYARLVTIGVANMVNVLDLEHVVIGGPLIKDLDRLAFRNEVRGYWNDYALRGQTVSHSYKSLKQIWQGAALLFWDPAYWRQLAR